MQNLKRQIAYKVKIKDLLIGEYVKKEGWEPSYILHNEKRITRIKIPRQACHSGVNVFITLPPMLFI